MADIQAALTRKFGPLPAWGWAGIAGGGIWWYRQHTGTASSASSGATPDTAQVGPYGQYPVDIGGGGLTGGGGSSGGGSGDTGSGAGVGTGDTGGSGTPAPVINVNAPPAAAGRPRAQRPKPQHRPKAAKPHGKTKRHPAAHKPSAPRKTSKPGRYSARMSFPRHAPKPPAARPKAPARKVTRR